jgi:putative tricarboxylic transport membrane protein
MFESAGTAFQDILTFQAVLALLAGTIVGILSGALPGGAVPTLVVLLGFSYGMDPTIALPLAIGMISTVPTGDTLPAVLLGMPGSTSGQATILDGNPLAKQGKAGVALSAAYFASLIGGVIGAAVLFVTIPVARPVVNSFGAAEFFILGIVAIAVVGVVSSGALLKGLMVGAMGLLVSVIGFDPSSGVARSTFDYDYLWSGIHIVPLVIGLFALPEFIDMVISDSPIAQGARGDMMKQATSGRREGMAHVLHNWPLVLRSAGLGVFVGILPGIGGSLAQWLAYASARQTVKGGTQTFGTGDIRGVIAPESANNAVDGGQLIPTLFFGVPGSVGMAIFLGFLVVLGLQPGPSMLDPDQNLNLTLTIVFSLVVANVFATSLALGFTPILAKIAFVPPNVLVPLVLTVLTMAAFQANFAIQDLIVMLFFGGLGFFMKTYGWPRPPIIISVVLGGIIEKFYGITSQTYGWSMFQRIPVLAILAITIGTGAYTVWIQRSVARNRAAQELEKGSLSAVPDISGGRDESEPHRPVSLPFRARLAPNSNGVFIAILGAFFVYFLALSTDWLNWLFADWSPLEAAKSSDWPLSAARLPRLVSIAGASLVAIYAVVHLSHERNDQTSHIMDIGRASVDLPRKILIRRTIKAIGTTVGLVLAIWLIGFQIAIPGYVMLYLWIFGKARWWAILIAGAVFIVLLYGFFDLVINVTWLRPQLEAITPDILEGEVTLRSWGPTERFF